MKNNLFDKHIKEELGNTRPEVPPHIWENIIANKERRTPVGFFYTNTFKILAVAVTLLIAITSSIYFLSLKNNPAASNSENTFTNVSDDKNKKIASAENAKVEGVNKDVVQEKTASKIIVEKTKVEEKNEKVDNTIIQFPLSSSITNNTPVSIKDKAPFIEKNNDYLINKSFLKTDLNFPSKKFNPNIQPLENNVSLFIPCPEAEKNTAGNKKYLEVYGGPDYVFHSLSDTSNSVYLAQRKSSLSYLFAYSAGFRYTKVFGSGMSFRTGINYSQINEQFRAEKGRITQNVYIINNNGDTTGSFVQSGTQYKTNTNKYRSIDIPISVGYELGNGRLHANINAGAMINILSSQKGFMLDNSGNAVDISSNKSSSIYQYKTKAGVSFIGATSIYYKLNDQFHLLAEPYVKLGLSPVTRPEISLKEKIHTAGVRFGVRMDF